MKVSTQEVFTTDDGKTFTDEAKDSIAELYFRAFSRLGAYCWVRF